MADRLKIAVVGAGIGGRHVEGVLANPELFEVAAICDLDADRARPVAEQAGARVETAFENLLHDADLDIIDICLPPNLHFPFALRALEAGKHLVVEKPLAASLAEVDQLAELSRREDRYVFPVFQYRFGNGVLKLKHLMEQGLVGKPFTATVETHWNREAPYYAVPWRGRFETELGGAIISHAIHAHDLLTWVMGPVAQVAAFTDVRVNPIETEDCAAIALKLHSGAMATCSITLGSAIEISRLRFCFEHLTVESALVPYRPGEDPWSFHPRGDAHGDRIAQALKEFVPAKENFPEFYRRMHGAITAGGTPPVSIEEGRASIALASAIYYASKHGEVVSLPIGSDHPAYSGWLP